MASCCVALSKLPVSCHNDRATESERTSQGRATRQECCSDCGSWPRRVRLSPPGDSRILDGLPHPRKPMTLRLKRLAVCAFVCAVVLVRVPAAQAQPTTTALFFDSQPGDAIGQGQQRTWSEGELSFRPLFGTTSSVSVRADNFSTSGSTWWDLTFTAPAGSALVPGVYENAGRTFGAPLRPGLNVGGSGRGCNGTGRFTIYEVAFDANGTLTTLAADFEQHCDDGVPALFGAIRYKSSRSSLVPFDGLYPVFSLHIDSSPYGNVAGAGIDCGDGGADCDETYAAATTTTLTVTPAPG
jgi:hypothetical protein